MPKDTKSLFESFQPRNYSLCVTTSPDKKIFIGTVVIKGKKIGKPSKRLTLHQKGLKIIAAKITRQDKRGPTEHKVTRINHLPTFEQVRLHTDDTLYPGPYVIELEFQLSPEKIKTLKNLGDKNPSRDLLPSIDEAEAWATSSIEIINSSGK